AADGVPGRRARRLGVSLGDGLARRLAQPPLVEPVAAADQGDHRPAFGYEHQRLDDLRNVAADGARGVGGRARSLRELLDRDVEPRIAKPRFEPGHEVRIGRFLQLTVSYGAG